MRIPFLKHEHDLIVAEVYGEQIGTGTGRYRVKLLCVDCGYYRDERAIGSLRLQLAKPNSTPEPRTPQIVISRHRARRSHCKRGHALTPANTIVEKDGTHRCRICRKASNRAFAQRNAYHSAERVEKARDLLHQEQASVSQLDHQARVLFPKSPTNHKRPASTSKRKHAHK